MTALAIQRTTTDFACHEARRVQQGEVAVGRSPMMTLLRSCVCIGCHHAGQGVGAISHVTGFSADGGHSAAGAVAAIESGLRRCGLSSTDCDWFVVGGADGQRHVLDATRDVLTRRRMSVREIDVLGSVHRKLLLRPSDGVLLLYSKERTSTTPDDTLGRFHDPKRRVITGASTLFRNERLLGLLRSSILPEVTMGDRLSFWCAGCSTGMEVYSVAMLTLDWLAAHRDGPPLRFGIVGSDIAEDALATAREGTYQVSQRVRKLYGPLLRRYTTAVDAGAVTMQPQVRAVTSFVRRDIADGVRRMRFDVVVCDHVLQYFTVPRQLELIRRLVAALRPGGFLFTSSPSRDVRSALMTDWGLHEAAPNLYRSIRCSAAG